MTHADGESLEKHQIYYKRNGMKMVARINNERFIIPISDLNAIITDSIDVIFKFATMKSVNRHAVNRNKLLLPHTMH